MVGMGAGEKILGFVVGVWWAQEALLMLELLSTNISSVLSVKVRPRLNIKT